MPSAEATRRGVALSCRLAVNGIQKDSSCRGFGIWWTVTAALLCVAGMYRDPGQRFATRPFLRHLKLFILLDRQRHICAIRNTSNTGFGMSVDIGGRLRFVRNRHKLSQRELAKRSGVPQLSLAL